VSTPTPVSKAREKRMRGVAARAAQLLRAAEPESVVAWLIADGMKRSKRPFAVAAEALKTEDPSVVLLALRLREVEEVVGRRR
jgi:hypothetical protein